MTDARDADEIREAMRCIKRGLKAEYVREVTPELIATYAEVSGDHHRLHVDEEYAASTSYGRRIAHGSMLVGFMSTASTILSDIIEEQIGRANVSLGYDKVRFIGPVFEGDTIVTRILLTEINEERLRALCEQECVNQNGETVAVAQHVMRFI